MSGSGGRGGRSGKGGADHPGGSAAVLGVRLIRYSGVQGAALAVGNLLQLATIFVIAHFLGPALLGRFGLLFFLAMAVSQVLVLASKPGTLRRVFGASDDDEDDDDSGGGASASPQRSLGVGLAWATLLGLVAFAGVVVAREPLADLLVGDPGATGAVVWAGAMGAAGAVFRLATIVLWFERRPGAFAIADVSRPALGLVAVAIALAAGAGIEGAIAGGAIGTAVAAVVGVGLLRSSFEPSFDLGEVGQIVKQGGRRAPIVMSFWSVQSADVFVLSRFVSDADLGIYLLASRLGFVVAFLPQGFRMAMRPLRRTAIFQAVRDQYGRATEQGQLLGYFALLCIFSVLLMVLGGELLVKVAPSSFADAAPLIPLTSAAMVMPSLFRTVNMTTTWPKKTRRKFIAAVVGGALLFFAVTIALAPAIGIYAAPVALIVGFGLPSAYFFWRCQRNRNRIEFPYREVLRGAVLAVAVGGGFHLLPDLPTALEVAAALGFLAAYLGLAVALRVVPRGHWPALAHMARSVTSGRPEAFNPRRGLRALAPGERRALHAAVSEGVPSANLAGDDDGAALVAALRRTGERGGVPVGQESAHDPVIARFLFADEPAAVRGATMRRLMDDGADSNDLRALEDLVTHLRRVPDEAWEGRAADKRGGRGSQEGAAEGATSA